MFPVACVLPVCILLFVLCISLDSSFFYFIILIYFFQVILLYSLGEIKERILHNLQKQVPFPEAVHRPPRRYRVRGKPRKKVTGLRALYFRYCYELHIIVKRPASVKRVSFLLREDIAKLDRLDAETRFFGKHRIGTIGELTAHRKTASAEINALTAKRQELRKELRRLYRGIGVSYAYLGGQRQNVRPCCA